MKARASFFFENNRARPLNVYVEPWPERFRLQPGEVLEIRYITTADGDEVRVGAHDDGVTLWANVGDDPEYLIDGKGAGSRSWRN